MTKVMMSHNGKIYWNALIFASILLFSGLAFVPNIVHADQVVSTIPVGSAPFAIATNPVTNKIYVGNSQSNNISVINGLTNTVASTIPVGSSPSSIKVNPATDMIYVTNHGSGTVSVIDGKTDTVVDTISGMLGPSGIAINQNTNFIYVADNSGKAVYVINGTTNVITTTIHFLNNEQPWSLVVNYKTSMIYVPTVCMYCPQSYVVVIDGHNNTRMENISLGKSPNYVDINSNTNMVYVSDVGEYNLYVIDSATNSVMSTIPISGDAFGVGVNPNTNLIYATSYHDDLIYVIDGTTNKIIHKIAIGHEPDGVAVNINTNMVYVTNTGDNTVSIIDGKTAQPQPPTSLTATATSSSQINLSWSAPTNDGGSPITGYLVERSSNNTPTWHTIVANTGTNETTYSDTNLASNTTYAYRVSAINSVGTSSPSNIASATTLITISLTVNSVDVLGNKISGIWMELHSANGNTIDVGYTPMTFNVDPGIKYTIIAANYLNYVFLHWNDGSMNAYNDIIPTTNATLTATYTP